MKKLVSVLCCALMALSMTACGSSSDAGSGTSVTIAKENDVISMDSTYATDGMSLEMIAATIDGLETVDKDGNVIPALAESHKTSEDGLTWTFTLRDAKWNNGETVTANDFVYAWKETVSDPTAEYAYLYTEDGACVEGAADIVAAPTKEEKVALKDKLGVKALDDKTLEIKLTKRCDYFLSLMSFPVFFPVNQKFAEAQGTDGKDYALTPDNLLACGPYKMVSWTKGSEIVLEKNDQYWDAANVKTDKLTVKIVAEASTSALDFESGNLDYTKLNSSLVDKYKSDKAYQSILEGYLWYLQYNMGSGKTGNEYLRNKNLRLALSYAVDREDLVNNVLKDGSITGTGFVPKLLATGPDGKDFRDTSDAYFSLEANDSLAKAKEYWEAAKKELGVSEISLRLLYEPSDPSKPAATYIQSNLERLDGLKIEMVSQEKENRIELQKKRDFDICLTRWGPDYADPTTYLNLLLHGNSYNYGDYESDAYNAKMKDAGNASDSEKRWELLKEAEKIAMEDAAVAPVFQVGGASLINPKVTGIENHAVGVPFIYKNLAKAE